MAANDYTVADRKISSLEAGDKVLETVQATPDADAAAFAADNGVSHPAYVGYAAALDAHASRADIEGLRERRLREYGDSFADGDFMRQAAYNADGTAADAPRPGTVYGDAPSAAGYTNDTPLSAAAAGDADGDGVYDETDTSSTP